MTIVPTDVVDNGKPDSCKLCPLYLSKEGIVWGDGPQDATMMFVGEGPGEEEGLTFKPFTGGSGRVFNAMLAHAGMKRSEVFVTNTVKCRPTARDSNGRIVNRKPTDTEIRCCARFLKNEIDTINPNVIVALGDVPMKTLTGVTKGITITRSVPHEGSKRTDGKAPVYKVIGTLHPAFVMRNQDYWPATVFDLVRARNESATPEIHRREWKRHIHARLSDVGDALRRRIRDVGHYHHDLETTGLDPRKDTFRCIGIAAEADEVYCFDWTGDVIAFVRELHLDASLITVGQNSEQFDIWFQEQKGFEFKGPSYDTMIGWHLLNPGLPKDLGFIGSSVTDEKPWKDDSMYKSGEDALQHGCCKDIHATARAFDDQMQELEMLGLKDLYFNHIMPLQPVLRNMTRRGIRKDVNVAGAWHKVLNRKADELEAKLKKGLGDATFDVNSPQQLMDLLYKRMGLPVQYKQTREGFRPTVDADALDALASISRNPILLLVRSIRTLRKWDTTFVCCDMDEDFIVHGHFSSAKAANGRLNSFDPNMQNFPVEVRGIMVPRSKDHVLLARDWSQIEWRIAMALSGDRTGLDALAAGRDAHSDAYANAFDYDYNIVTKAQRFEAKTYNYGLLYGRGADSLAKGRPGHPESAIPLERVSDYISRFYAKFAGYKKFRDTIEQGVARDHYIATPWGRRRYWYTRGRMPEAFNFPISGTAAHMMYEALVELEAQLPKGAELILTVHDEVVVDSLKEQKVLKQALECTRDVMERAFPQITEASLYPDVVRHYYPNGWFCESDVHIGSNWKMTKGEEDDVPLELELRKQLGVEDMFE